MARLAARQHGVVSREQLARLGATKDVIRRRLDAGRWESPVPGAFRIAGAPPSWRQSIMAACLAWGPGVVASHRAAAPLWRLAGFEPGAIELTAPRGRRRARPGIVHRNALTPADRSTVDAVPVTAPARTLLDLASVAARDAVEEALDDALRRGLVSIARLRRRLAGWERARRSGVRVLRSLADARDGRASVPQSVLETRLLRLLSRAALPRPVRQHPVREGGRLVAVVDFAFPDVRVGIEADGYRWHSGRLRWEHDRARRNRLTVLGWRIIHVTWGDLAGRPESVIEEIGAAVARAPTGAAQAAGVSAPAGPAGV